MPIDQRRALGTQAGVAGASARRLAQTHERAHARVRGDACTFPERPSQERVSDEARKMAKRGRGGIGMASGGTRAAGREAREG